MPFKTVHRVVLRYKNSTNTNTWVQHIDPVEYDEWLYFLPTSDFEIVEGPTEEQIEYEESEIIGDDCPVVCVEPYEEESTSGNYFNFNTLTNDLAVYERTVFTNDWIIDLTGIEWSKAIVLDIVGYDGSTFIQQKPQHKYESNKTIKISFPFPSIGKVYLIKIN